MSDSKLSVPTAIVIAGFLVGAGLFFGLRSRGPDVVPIPSVPSSLATAASTPSASPTSEAPQRERAAVPIRPDDKKVVSDAAAALQAQRATLTRMCWEPAVRLAPTPAHIDYAVDITFDAAGNQVARGMSEDRKTGRADVTSCVTANMKPLTVPAPGAIVRVEVPFRLP